MFLGTTWWTPDEPLCLSALTFLLVVILSVCLFLRVQPQVLKWGHFWWLTMSSDIQTFVASCPVCASVKVPCVSSAQTPRKHHLRQRSSVLKAFCRLFRIKDSLSYGFQPQTNDKVERYNQDLESVLRAMCTKNPNTWSSQLLWAEYSHNALVNSSGISPFSSYLWQGFQETAILLSRSLPHHKD